MPSRLSVQPDTVIVTSLKPSADGKAWIVRLFNPGEKTQSRTLKGARRRWDKVLGLPDARAILADDSLDR